MSFVDNFYLLNYTTSTTSYPKNTCSELLFFINSGVKLLLCIMSVIVNSLMFRTVHSLSCQNNSPFLLGIHLLVALEICLCAMNGTDSFMQLVKNICVIDLSQNVIFDTIIYYIYVSRNYWIVCITGLRMLKVCFPLKERILITKSMVKWCFIAQLILASFGLVTELTIVSRTTSISFTQ